MTVHAPGERTAIQSPEHLKAWLHATGRSFVVLESMDLIDALPWPDGVQAFMMCVEAYRQHRQTVAVEHTPCPKLRVHSPGRICALCHGKGEVVARSKTDVLEIEEMKSAVVFLLNQIREKDPKWNPFE